MGESTFSEKQVVSGRLLCDTYVAAKDTIKAKSYSLSNLSNAVLSVERHELDFETIPNYYSDANNLVWLTQHCENDAYLSMKLAFHMMFIPLTKQLTNLAGNLWTRTMAGARAERNEFLLLHEFFKNGYIVPDKSYPQKQTNQPAKSKATKNAKVPSNGTDDKSNDQNKADFEMMNAAEDDEEGNSCG